MKRVYFDTNIFVYAASNDAARRRRALAAIKRETGRTAAVTSFLTINEFIWVTRRLHDTSTALDAAAKILEAPGLEILPIGLQETRLALELMAEHKLSPHDASHAAVAIRNGCRGILTFDRDFADLPGLTWIKP